METMARTAGTRLVFLDWVRILAFGWLVLYHVGMYYVSWSWHVKSPHAGIWLEPWMRLSSPWRMDLLFLVSGAATSMMLLREGASTGLLRQRLGRLLWPLVFGVLVVVPPQSWREVVFRFGYEGSYGEFLRLYLSGYSDFCAGPGRCLVLPTWNHLWFLPYLLSYTLLLWLLLRRWPGLLQRLAAALPRVLAGSGLLLWPVLFLAALLALLRARFPDTRALVDDWHAHSHFLAAFLLGAVLARCPGMWTQFAQRRWRALVAALLAWLLLLGATPAWGALWPLPSALAGLLFAVQQWCAIVAALGFAQVHLRSDGALRRYLTEAVFPVYILHQTLIIVLAWQLAPFNLQPVVEAPLLVLLTLGLAFALFEVVRRWRWMRPWFGLQPALR